MSARFTNWNNTLGRLLTIYRKKIGYGTIHDQEHSTMRGRSTCTYGLWKTGVSGGYTVILSSQRWILTVYEGRLTVYDQVPLSSGQGQEGQQLTFWDKAERQIIIKYPLSVMKCTYPLRQDKLKGKISIFQRVRRSTHKLRQDAMQLVSSSRIQSNNWLTHYERT